MTPQVFIAIVLAFVAGLGPGAALLLWGVAQRIKRSESFAQGVVAACMAHPRLLIRLYGATCPLCGSGPVEGPGEPASGNE